MSAALRPRLMIDFPTTPQERETVQEQLGRIERAQGRLEAKVEGLGDKLDDFVKAVDARFSKIESARQDEAAAVRTADGLRHGFRWFVGLLIAGVVTAGLAGQLGWLGRIGRWLER